MIKIKEFLIYL